jgi:hypothetical protein
MSIMVEAVPDVVLTKPSRKRRMGRWMALSLVLAMLGALGWYYDIKTSYPVRPIDARVVFQGSELGFYYLYEKDKPFYRRPSELFIDGFAAISLSGRLHRQPVTHCNYALMVHSQFLDTHDPALRREFLDLANTLLASRHELLIAGVPCTVWQYDFEAPFYAPHPVPWISALAQGEAMSVLLRAYELTREKKYRDAAQEALNVFGIPMEAGGIRSLDSQGHVYFEEYPFPNKAHKVLNGFIYALLGLYDCWRATGNPIAKQYFDEGLHTLRAEGILQRYDLGFWTSYDQRPDKDVCFKYNSIHVRQLEVLYRISGDVYFLKISQQWKRYNLEHRYRCQFFYHAVIFYCNHHDKLPANVLLL